jgi:hypothetical protein
VNDYQAYLSSEGWKAKRNMILNMWGNRCALCNEGGELHLHHRDYSRVGNEEVTDVIPLCKKHHEIFHGKSTESVLSDQSIKFGKLVARLGFIDGYLMAVDNFKEHGTELIKSMAILHIWERDFIHKNGRFPTEEEENKVLESAEKKAKSRRIMEKTLAAVPNG